MDKRVISTDMKKLNSLWIIQKNLVYVIGLPETIAFKDILLSESFFG